MIYLDRKKFLFLSIVLSLTFFIPLHKTHACPVNLNNTGDTFQTDRCSEGASGGYFANANGSWNESGGDDGGQGFAVLCVLDPDGAGTNCDVQGYNNQGSASGGIGTNCGNTACTAFDLTIQSLKTVQMQASASGGFVGTPSPSPSSSPAVCSPDPDFVVDGQSETFAASGGGPYHWDYGSGFVATGGGDPGDRLAGYWPTAVGWTTVSVANSDGTGNCSVYVNNAVSPDPVPPAPGPGPGPSPSPSPSGPSMSGYVYRDLNTYCIGAGCGVIPASKDAGEPGISGETVLLTNVAGDTTFDTQVTDSWGHYSFTGLTNGSANYRVTHYVPIGYVRTTDDSVSFTASGALTHDFGIYMSASDNISGKVYNDLNGSKSLNFGEPGIGGVTVTLYDCVDPGPCTILVVHDTKISGPDGSYFFDSLPIGPQYRVTYTLPSGWADSSFDQSAKFSDLPRIVNFGMRAVAIPQYSITITKDPAAGGMVTSVPSRVNCGVTCSTTTSSFDVGTNVTLNVNPSSSYWKFNGWAGACSGLGSCVFLNLQTNKSVQASFVPRYFNYREF